MISNSTTGLHIIRFFLLSAFLLLASLNLLAQNHTVNITDFTVSAKEQKVMIDWKTDGATSTNYFEIQKSSDGVNFKTIAMVLGPDPKKTTCDCYGCFDKYLMKKSSQAFYRLVHVDVEGNQQISSVKILSKA